MCFRDYFSIPVTRHTSSSEGLADTRSPFPSQQNSRAAPNRGPSGGRLSPRPQKWHCGRTKISLWSTELWTTVCGETKLTCSL